MNFFHSAWNGARFGICLIVTNPKGGPKSNDLGTVFWGLGCPVSIEVIKLTLKNPLIPSYGTMLLVLCIQLCRQFLHTPKHGSGCKRNRTE